jgi:hypothetical protein
VNPSDDFARKCAGWTDANLLAEYAAGPAAYADPELREVMRAELVRRGFEEQAATAAPVAPPAANQEPCRGCGRRVSVLALKCPHCGTAVPTVSAQEQGRSGKRMLLIGAMAIFAISIVLWTLRSKAEPPRPRAGEDVRSADRRLSPGSGSQSTPPEVGLAMIEENTRNPQLSTIEDFRSMLVLADATCTDRDPAKVAGFVFAAYSGLRDAGIPLTVRRVMQEMAILRTRLPGFNASCAELSAYVQTVYLARQRAGIRGVPTLGWVGRVASGEPAEPR